MKDKNRDEKVSSMQEDELRDREADDEAPLWQLFQTLFAVAQVLEDAHTHTLDLDCAPLSSYDGWPPIPRCQFAVKSYSTRKSFSGFPYFCILDPDIAGPCELDYECNRLIREIEACRLKGRGYFREAERKRKHRRKRTRAGAKSVFGKSRTSARPKLFSQGKEK